MKILEIFSGKENLDFTLGFRKQKMCQVAASKIQKNFC